MKRLRQYVFGLALMLGVVFAQDSTGSGTTDSGTADSSSQSAATQPAVMSMDTDSLFIMTAAQGDLFEITSSQLALERAESQEVRDFAQQMIDDHTATTEQLTPLASELGVTPPTEPNPMQQFMLAHLQTLQGADFDTAYMRHQVLSHSAAVDAYTTAAAGGVQNESLVNFASQNLPTIEQHLSMAQQMAQPMTQPATQ
jgi:putative membrane protein